MDVVEEPTAQGSTIILALLTYMELLPEDIAYMQSEEIY